MTQIVTLLKNRNFDTAEYSTLARNQTASRNLQGAIFGLRTPANRLREADSATLADRRICQNVRVRARIFRILCAGDL